MIPDGHDWLDLLPLIVAIVAAFGGAFAGWFFSRRKTASETHKTDAETAGLYQDIADKAAERALKLEERITALEAVLKTKDERIDELEQANAQKDKEIADLRCQVELLQQKVFQLEGKRNRSNG